MWSTKLLVFDEVINSHCMANSIGNVYGRHWSGNETSIYLTRPQRPKIKRDDLAVLSGYAGGDCES